MTEMSPLLIIISSVLGTLGGKEIIARILYRNKIRADLRKTEKETDKVGVDIRKVETDIFTAALNAAGDLIEQLKKSNGSYLSRIGDLEDDVKKMKVTVAVSEEHRAKCETELAEIRQKLGMK